MVKFQNIKIKKPRIISLFFIISLISCTNSKKEYYQLMNQNFLAIVDTFPAYQCHKFIITPGENIPATVLNKYEVLVYPILKDSEKFKNSLKSILEKKGQNYNEYIELLKKNTVAIDSFELDKITQTGKFSLINSALYSKKKIDLDLFVGGLIFYKPFLNDKRAIICFQVASGSKSAREDAVLFAKENDEWKFKERITLGWY